MHNKLPPNCKIVCDKVGSASCPGIFKTPCSRSPNWRTRRLSPRCRPVVMGHGARPLSPVGSWLRRGHSPYRRRRYSPYRRRYGSPGGRRFSPGRRYGSQGGRYSPGRGRRYIMSPRGNSVWTHGMSPDGSFGRPVSNSCNPCNRPFSPDVKVIPLGMNMNPNIAPP